MRKTKAKVEEKTSQRILSGLLAKLDDFDSFAKGGMLFDVQTCQLIGRESLGKDGYDAARFITYDQWFDKDAHYYTHQFTAQDKTEMVCILCSF